MQNIVLEEPYKFVPPHRGNWWPNFIQWSNLYGIYLRRHYGVVEYECRGVERLRQSLDAGHGILLTPNHCRLADALVLGFLGREARCHVFAMGSWHLFKQDWFTAWAIRKMGGFSVYREGADRKAIDTAIGVLRTAERPLVLFPEGAVSRTNDVLHALQDGVAFIARTAAKRRAKDIAGGKVVVHPVALKYLFGGDLKQALTPVLAAIEERFAWQPQDDLPLIERITKVGMALLALKELEYFGQVQEGLLAERLQGLTDRLLCPLEEEWIGEAGDGPVVPRVKALRMRILPDMVNGDVTEEERARRWRQLADIYLAQQVSCYVPDYLDERPSVSRLLETVERFEEDLTDKLTVHGSLKIILQVDDAIEVDPKRDRKAAVDPLMAVIEQRMSAMLAKLAEESPLYEE